jgi:hypothetical protein
MALVIQSFTSSTTWTVPNGVYLINEVFVVGGGGGGGSNRGGGGGGGSYQVRQNYAVTAGASVSVVVGNGGGNNANGQSSSFDGTITATGGGAGAPNYGNGGVAQGGSGGTGYSSTKAGAIRSSWGTGGGGASNTAPGKNAGDYPGDGGNGFLYTTNNTYYGGGGQGGSQSTTQFGRTIPRRNSLGGGGGSGRSGVGQAGTANTGGGGGGGGASQNGGAGGRGIVILTYYEPGYELTADTTGIGEGETITFNLRTDNVRNGAVVPFTISGTGVVAADFAPASLTGTFTVTSLNDGATGTASASVTLVNDSTTEGNEVATLTLNGLSESITFVIGDSSIGAVSNPESKTIQVADYNNIQSKVATVLGTGSLDNGWGQTVFSSQVTVSNKVSLSEWSNLRYDIINAWQHIYGTTPTLVTATQSDKIKANSLTAPYKQYESYANVIEARKIVQPPSSEAVTTVKTPQSYTGSWSTGLSATVTVDFTTREQARFFFNSGGEIRFTSTHAGDSGTTQNTTWASMLTQSAPVFGGAKPEIGTSPADAKNFHRLTTTYQTWFTATATSPYATNTFKISARQKPTDSSAIEFFVEWIDDHIGIGGGPDTVSGTTSLNITTYRASGILQPAGSGNFTTEEPTVTIGSITGS